nr:hypothetical protein [Sphingopyxis indica]
MARDIGERFLRDAVERDFGGGGELERAVRCAEASAEPGAPFEALGEDRQRGAQPGAEQLGRDDLVERLHLDADRRDRLGDRAAERLGLVRALDLAEREQAELDRDELLRHVVVEFARDAPPLFLFGEQEGLVEKGIGGEGRIGGLPVRRKYYR